LKVVGFRPCSRDHRSMAMAHCGPALQRLSVPLPPLPAPSRSSQILVLRPPSLKAAESPSQWKPAVLVPSATHRRVAGVARAIQQRSFGGGVATARCPRVVAPSLSSARSRLPVLLRSLSPNRAVNADAPPAMFVPTARTPNLGSLGACRGAGRRLPSR